MEKERCYGCEASFFVEEKGIKGDHPYIGANSECWLLYRELLAKEFADPTKYKVNRVTVDAYAAQHIGDQTDRRARQSAWIHLIALYAGYVKKMLYPEVLECIRAMTEKKRDWPMVTQRKNPQWLTVKDIFEVEESALYQAKVVEWGKSVWESYSDMYESIQKEFENINRKT